MSHIYAIISITIFQDDPDLTTEGLKSSPIFFVGNTLSSFMTRSDMSREMRKMVFGISDQV